MRQRKYDSLFDAHVIHYQLFDSTIGSHHFAQLVCNFRCLNIEKDEQLPGARFTKQS